LTEPRPNATNKDKDRGLAMITWVEHRILCVDDDAELLELLRESLGRLEGTVVRTATNVSEARQLLMEQDFSVVVTDQRMPGENGLDLLEEISRRGLDTVPLLLTGHADLELSIDAVNRGHVFALLRKPCRISELSVVVKSACERYALGQRLRRKLVELQQTHDRLRQQYEELQLAHAEVQRLEGLASIDAKTGTYNFRYFKERLEEEFARARRYSRPLSLLLIDLDGFKQVNDRHGHLCGSRALVEAAAIIRGCARETDVAARFGGDEFAIVLPDTDGTGAVAVGERLRDRLCAGRFLEAEGLSVPLTASIGIATLPDVASSAEELLRAADVAMYRVKTAGKNGIYSARGEDLPPPAPR
jgi:two-component system, cell cycle response regulator